MSPTYFSSGLLAVKSLVGTVDLLEFGLVASVFMCPPNRVNSREAGVVVRPANLNEPDSPLTNWT